MNRYEATEKIRWRQEIDNHIPIFSLTTRTVLGEREKYLQTSLDDYASKSLVNDTLEKLIIKALKL